MENVLKQKPRIVPICRKQTTDRRCPDNACYSKRTYEDDAKNYRKHAAYKRPVTALEEYPAPILEHDRPVNQANRQ